MPTTITIEGDLARLLETYRRARAKRRKIGESIPVDGDPTEEQNREFTRAHEAELHAADMLAMGVSSAVDLAESK